MCDYNISIDKLGTSKHNKTLLRYKESKDRHISIQHLVGGQLTTHQMLYTYIICKTNDISFTTHPLVVAYYELMYHKTL